MRTADRRAALEALPQHLDRWTGRMTADRDQVHPTPRIMAERETMGG